MAVSPDSYKIKSLIDEERKKIETLYTELGKMYFDSHIDCYEEVFEPLMSELILAFKNTDQYEAQLAALNGNLICPSCKAESPKGAQFCISCGTPLSAPAPTEDVCRNCNAPLIPGAQFCTVCGKKISSPETNISAASIVSVCHKCGAALPYGTKFCTSCGTAVNTNPSTTATTVASVVHTCAKCGIPLDFGTKFCTSCGAKVESTESNPITPISPSVSNPSLSTCLKCGTLLEPGSKFCTSCGAKRG